MKVRRVIQEEVASDDGSAVSVNAAVAANVAERAASTRVRSKQRIVQRSGKTRVTTQRDVQTESEGRG